MESESGRDTALRALVGIWNRGAGAGAAGAFVMILYNHFVFGVSLFALVGLTSYGVLWGVVYAGFASIGQVREYTREPVPGVILAVTYSLAVWLLPNIGVPGFASAYRIIEAVLFGVAVGLVVVSSPDSPWETERSTDSATTREFR